MKKHALWAILGGGAVVEVTAASFARPFTWSADCVVAIALGGLVAIVIAQHLAHPVPQAIARQPQPASPATGDRQWGRRWALWVVPIGAAVGWELFCYTAAPRAAHPTVSSMLDAVDTNHVGHAVAFAGWLALGWYVATR